MNGKELTPFLPGFVYGLKVQLGVFKNPPLMFSETSKAIPMKLCTVIVVVMYYTPAHFR